MGGNSYKPRNIKRLNLMVAFSLTASPAEVKEKLVAPKFIVEIQTVEATIGETAKFTCKAIGQPKPQILWFKNDKEISKTDNRFSIQYGDEGEETLLIVDILPEHDGTYTVEAKNPAGIAKCKAELFVEGKWLNITYLHC